MVIRPLIAVNPTGSSLLVLFLHIGLPIVLLALVVAISSALEQGVKHCAQFLRLLPDLTVLLFDSLNVVVQAEHIRELFVLLDLFYHFLTQTYNPYL